MKALEVVVNDNEGDAAASSGSEFINWEETLVASSQPSQPQSGLSSEAHCWTHNESNSNNSGSNNNHGNNNNTRREDVVIPWHDSPAAISSSRKGEKRRKVQLSPTATVARYLFLSFLAAGLTVFCPETSIYEERVNHVASLFHPSDPFPLPRVNGILLVYGMVLITLFVVFRSDPGFITVEMMKEWTDGASLLLEGKNEDRMDHDDSRSAPEEYVGDGGGVDLEENRPSHESHDFATVAAAASPRKRCNSSSPPYSFSAERRVVSRTLEEDNDVETIGNSELDPLTTAPHAVTAPNFPSHHHPEMLPLSTTAPPTTTRRPVCTKCGFAPPLRSHHCKVCNRHVAMFDHHCDVIGTCIGERNHCRFWWFLTAQAVAFLYLVHTVGSSPYGFVTLFFPDSDYHHSSMFNNNNNQSDTGGEPNSKDIHRIVFYSSAIVVATKLYVYPLALMGWVVWVMHTFLALTNSTTFECSKGARHLEYLRGTQASDLPYSFRRLDQSLVYFCCQRDACCTKPKFACRGFSNCVGGSFATAALNDTQEANRRGASDWKPTVWYPPGKMVRDSEKWWEHPWQNKYWSCC